MKNPNAIGDRITRPEIRPLVEVPIGECGNELWPICEQLDLHDVRSVT